MKCRNEFLGRCCFGMFFEERTSWQEIVIPDCKSDQDIFHVRSYLSREAVNLNVYICKPTVHGYQ